MDTHLILDLLKVSFIAAILNIDNKNITSLGISRPLIAGAILGYFTNNIYFGIFAGCIIELIIINLLPVGAYIPPNATVIIGVTIMLSYYFHVYKAGILLPAILVYAIFCGHVAKRLSRILWMKNVFIVERFLKDVQDLKFHFFINNVLVLLMDFIAFFILIFLCNFLGVVLFKRIVNIFFTSFFINSVFEKAFYYLPLIGLLFVLNSFDVPNKIFFLLIGIITAFLLNLVISSPVLIVIIIGFVSYLGFYSIHRYREHHYGL